jgi:tetratricopeptide (TPR) repeat protein
MLEANSFHSSRHPIQSPSVSERLENLEKPSTASKAVIDWEEFVRQSMSDLNQAYKTLVLKENAPDVDERELVGCLDHLSEIHHSLGNYKIAENYYRRSLGIKERNLGNGDGRLIRAYLNLGILHRIQNDYEEAEEYYLRALRCAADPDHRNVPEADRCFFHLSGLYHAQGRYLEAGSLLRKGLEDLENQPGANDFARVTGYTALALINVRQGNVKEARKLLSDAGKWIASELGGDGKRLEHKLVSMALIYATWERYEEAEFLVRQSVTAREEHLWQYQPLLPNAIVTIANLCSARGQEEQAESMYWTALEKQVKSAGPYHKTMIDALTRLANFYSLQLRYQDAAPLLEHAVKLSEIICGAQSWETAARLEQYAEALEKIGQSKAADSARKRAKRIKVGH